MTNSQDVKDSKQFKTSSASACFEAFWGPAKFQFSTDSGLNLLLAVVVAHRTKFSQIWCEFIFWQSKTSDMVESKFHDTCFWTKSKLTKPHCVIFYLFLGTPSLRKLKRVTWMISLPSKSIKFLFLLKKISNAKVWKTSFSISISFWLKSYGTIPRIKSIFCYLKT